MIHSILVLKIFQFSILWIIFKI